MINEDKIWCVYKHTNKINNKIYIGITSQDPEVRWRKGKAYKSNIHFDSAIQKYGWDNFGHEIIETNLTKKEAELKEIELIAYYNSTNQDYGYNIQNGGMSNGKFTEETKKKMSEALKGKCALGENANAIRVICEGVVYDSIIECANHYQILRDTMESWLRGDKCMPLKFYNMGLKYVDRENHIRVSEDKRRTNNNSLSTKVLCDNLTFNTVKECAEYYDIKYTTMYAWLNGYNKMPKLWVDKGLKYLDEILISNEEGGTE